MATVCREWRDLVVELLGGVDPGTIGTGITIYCIDDKTFTTHYFEDWDKLLKFIKGPEVEGCEWYMETGARMSASGNHEFMKRYNALINELSIDDEHLVLNTGIKRVIPDDLLKILDLYDEKEPTHHKDIRSSSRILLYAMAKKHSEVANDMIDSKVEEWK